MKINVRLKYTGFPCTDTSLEFFNHMPRKDELIKYNDQYGRVEEILWEYSELHDSYIPWIVLKFE